MEKSKINNFTNESETKEVSKELYDTMMHLCSVTLSDAPKDEDDYWSKALPALLTFANQPQNNTALEKEIAYMRGRLDVLEKIVIEDKRK